MSRSHPNKQKCLEFVKNSPTPYSLRELSEKFDASIPTVRGWIFPEKQKAYRENRRKKLKKIADKLEKGEVVKKPQVVQMISVCDNCINLQKEIKELKEQANKYKSFLKELL